MTQKILIIFNAERIDGKTGSRYPTYEYCFAKNSKEVTDRAKEKCGVGKLCRIWTCDWRDLSSSPVHVFGPTGQTPPAVFATIKAVRDQAQIKPDPPTRFRVPKLHMPQVKVKTVLEQIEDEVTKSRNLPAVITVKEEKRAWHPAYTVKGV